MINKDIDDKLLNVFKDCPYKGKRKNCVFLEMREMEINDRRRKSQEVAKALGMLYERYRQVRNI